MATLSMPLNIHNGCEPISSHASAHFVLMWFDDQINGTQYENHIIHNAAVYSVGSLRILFGAFII